MSGISAAGAAALEELRRRVRKDRRSIRLDTLEVHAIERLPLPKQRALFT